jgi:hypothetical protein
VTLNVLPFKFEVTPVPFYLDNVQLDVSSIVPLNILICVVAGE